MQGLLPDNIIQDLLQTTGAYGGGEPSRLVANGTFKKFNFQQKKKSEFDVSIFEDSFDLIKKRIQEDWQAEFSPDCQLIRQKGELKDLNKYKLREESFCCQYKSELFADSFFIFLGRETFFCLLNYYLGGDLSVSEKSNAVLTDIEDGILQQLVKRLAEYYQQGLKTVYEVPLKFAKAPLSDADQKPDLKSDFLVSEMEMALNDKKFKLAIAVPLALLNLLKEQQQSGGDSVVKKLDPLWQKVISDACLDSQLDLKFQLDQLNIKFGESLNLKVGDVFPWDKSNNHLTVYYNEEPRMTGAIGIIDGNFAVRIDELSE